MSSRQKRNGSGEHDAVQPLIRVVHPPLLCNLAYTCLDVEHIPRSKNFAILAAAARSRLNSLNRRKPLTRVAPA